MEKGDEVPSTIGCQLCGELFTSCTDLSKHLTNSPCGASRGIAMSSRDRIVAVSSGGRIVTVTNAPTIQLQDTADIRVEEISSSCLMGMEDDDEVADVGASGDGQENNAPIQLQHPEDIRITDVRSISLMEVADYNTADDGQESKVTVSSGSVTPSTETGGISTAPLTVSLMTTEMPSDSDSDSRVLPAAVAIPVSGVEQSLLAHGSLFVTHESGMVKIFSSDGKDVAVVDSVPLDLSCLGHGSKEDEPQVSTAISIPTEGFLGQVAMEIHVPMHTQLIVRDYVEGETEVQTDGGREVVFVETNEERVDNKDGASRSDEATEEVLSVPLFTWPSAEPKKIRKRSKKRATAGKALPKFCCEICGKTFSKSSNLFRHKQTHSGKKFSCTKCDKDFRSKETLKIHNKSFHNESDPLFSTLSKCKFCQRLFPSISDLGIHLRTHIYDKPFRCHNCQKTFISARSLSRHELIHTSEKEYKCDVCHKYFLRKASLKRHQMIHMEDKPFECSHCFKTFANKSTCVNHEKLHNEDRPFACQYCLKFFKTATSVRVHETIHTRAKTHACDKCSEKFGTTQDLRQHMKEHWRRDSKENDAIEANQCKECGAKFTQRTSLRAHERTHTGELPYDCEICHKSFAYYSSWNRHAKMHKGEKAHVCKRCGKGFTKKMYLSRHKKGFCPRRKRKAVKQGGEEKEALETGNSALRSFSDVATIGKVSKTRKSPGKASSRSARSSAKLDKPANPEAEMTRKSRNHTRKTSAVNESLFVSSRLFSPGTSSGAKVDKPSSSTRRKQKIVKQGGEEKGALETGNSALRSSPDVMTIGKVSKTRKSPGKASPVCDPPTPAKPTSLRARSSAKFDKPTNPVITRKSRNRTRKTSTVNESPFESSRLSSPDTSYGAKVDKSSRSTLLQKTGVCETSSKSTSFKRSIIARVNMRADNKVGPSIDDKPDTKEDKDVDHSHGDQVAPFVEKAEPRIDDIVGSKSGDKVESDDKVDRRVDNKIHRKVNSKVYPKEHVKPVSSNKDKVKHNVKFKDDNPAMSVLVQGKHKVDQVAKVLSEMNRVAVKPFACELCGRMYATKPSLQRHQKMHENKKQFLCDICNKSYSTPLVLEEHKVTIHGVKSKKTVFKCKDCPKSYMSKKRLEVHSRTHTGEAPHSCPICSKSFKESGNLKRHLLVHTDIKPFKCIICDRGFNDKGNCVKHEATHGIKGEKDGIKTWTPLACRVCGKTFKQLGYLRYHERLHESKDSFPCTLCDRKFIQAGNLQAHMRSHEDKPFKCPRCRFAFSSEDKLERHISIRHNAEKKLFPCGVCGKVLRSKKGLTGHEEQHRGKAVVKDNVCAICDQTFDERKMYKKHKRAHKKEKRSTTCGVCGKVLGSKKTLTRHEKRHSGKAVEADTVQECAIRDHTYMYDERKSYYKKRKRAHRKGKI